MSRAGAFAFWATCLWLAAIGGAAAHPLGNFTINHLARIDARGNAPSRPLRPRHRRDSDVSNHARRRLDRDASARVGKRRGGARRARASRAGGRRRPAAASKNTSARTRPGAGGLPILYWTGDYSTALHPAPRSRLAIAFTPTAASAGKTSSFRAQRIRPTSCARIRTR